MKYFQAYELQKKLHQVVRKIPSLDYSLKLRQVTNEVGKKNGRQKNSSIFHT